MVYCTNLNLPTNVKTIDPLFQVAPTQTKPKLVIILWCGLTCKLGRQGALLCALKNEILLGYQFPNFVSLLTSCWLRNLVEFVVSGRWNSAKGTFFQYYVKALLEAKVTVSGCHNFLAVWSQCHQELACKISGRDTQTIQRYTRAKFCF